MIKFDIKEITGFAHRWLIHGDRYMYYSTLLSDITLKGINEGIILPKTINILNRAKYVFRSYRKKEYGGENYEETWFGKFYT